MFNRTVGLGAGLALLLTGCALPNGPSVMVLPGSSKHFAQFRGDDAQCRQFAYGQIGGKTPGVSAVGAGADTTVAGGATDNTGQTGQERYDMYYIQCMYAQGHKVPVYGRFTSKRAGGPQLAPEGRLPAPPAPPPGSPPPPPWR